MVGVAPPAQSTASPLYAYLSLTAASLNFDAVQDGNMALHFAANRGILSAVAGLIEVMVSRGIDLDILNNVRG